LKAGDTFNEMALMTGDAVFADFISESRCDVLLIPVSLVQSVIVSEPGAVQHISRTIAERMKSVMSDPVKATATLHKGDDSYGLKLKGERPEKILVINCGSSSLKYSYYDTPDESRHAHGQVERIGIDGTRLKHHGPKGEVKKDLPKGGFPEALKAMLTELTAEESGVISGAGAVFRPAFDRPDYARIPGKFPGAIRHFSRRENPAGAIFSFSFAAGCFSEGSHYDFRNKRGFDGIV
jgi:acetate kinase